MECDPCSYSVTYSPFFCSKHFLCLESLREGKSCQNCLCDALILIITGGFLLQTGQLFNPAEGRQAFPERAAPWQHVVLKSETYTEQWMEDLFSRTFNENLLYNLTTFTIFCPELFLLVFDLKLCPHD